MGSAAREKGRQAVVTVGAAYLAAVVLFHAVVAAGVVVARRKGHRPHAPASIDIPNLRRVDDRVWASGQPDPDHCRELAAAGVVVIVDLRTGEADDRGRIDPGELARLGVAHVRLPLQDGHTPDDDLVQRVVGLVEGHRGIALLHCGAGVGRSSSVAAGYLREQGEDVSLWDALALGPVSLAQVWYLTTGGRNPVLRRTSEALDAPRRARSRLRRRGWTQRC